MRVVLPLTLRRCRDAARAVHHTEDGPAAVRRLRGERMGFYRSRPVLALLLYLAAAQGRLVWRSPREFACWNHPLRTMVGRDPAGTHGGPSESREHGSFCGSSARCSCCWPRCRLHYLPDAPFGCYGAN